MCGCSMIDVFSTMLFFISIVTILMYLLDASERNLKNILKKYTRGANAKRIYARQMSRQNL